MVPDDPAHYDQSAQMLATLAQELALSASDDTTADTVVQRAVSHVVDADKASITLRTRRHRYTTFAATDDIARELDDLQYALAEGPCVGAADGHDWYRSGDVGADGRWPRWGVLARDLGVGSLLSVRLLRNEQPIGALNFYSGTEGGFADRDAVDFAILYATHAAIALASSHQVAGLETALQSRHEIGLAQGMLMERYGLDADRSFSLLQRLSSTTNTRLATVAADLVRSGRLPPQAPDPDQTP